MNIKISKKALQSTHIRFIFKNGDGKIADFSPWAHIDIVGTAFNEGPHRGEIPQFGTGFGVRLAVHYLKVRNNL